MALAVLSTAATSDQAEQVDADLKLCHYNPALKTQIYSAKRDGRCCSPRRLLVAGQTRAGRTSYVSSGICHTIGANPGSKL